MNKHHPQLPGSLITLLMRLKRTGNSEDGFIIFITVAMTLLLGFLWTASALMSKVDTASANAAEDTSTGFYAAEFGLNQRANQVRSTFEGYGLPSGTSPTNWSACVDSDSSNDGSGDLRCQTQTLAAAGSSRGSQQVSTFVQDKNSGGSPTLQSIPNSEPFGGLKALEYRYQVNSVALNSNRLKQPSAVLGMQFKSRLIPLFQFAAFYNDDLDFYSPPTMNLNGRIHTNANLYLNSSDILSINGQVSAAGVNVNTGAITTQPLIRGEKDNTSFCDGIVRIMRDRGRGWQNLNCIDSNTRTRYAQTTTTPSNISDWGANLQLNVPKLTVPSPGEFAPTAGATYWQNADLRIVLNVVNDSTAPSRTRVSSIEVQNADGTQNATATTALNSCAGMNSTGSTAVQTNLTASLASTSKGAGTLPADWMSVTDNTAGQFRVGDVVTIGDGSTRDWDSNVVIGPTIPISTINPPTTYDPLSDGSPTTYLANEALPANPGTTSSEPLSTPVWNGTGNKLRLRRAVGVGSSNSLAAVNTAAVRKAVVSSSDTFYNYREKYDTAGNAKTGWYNGQYIRMLNVDVRELMNCAHNQPNLMGGKLLSDTTQGGLVWYFTVKDNNGNTNNFRKYAIRLYNGRSLASTIPGAPAIAGLTVVSNQAVYVQGNYNLKDDAATTPPSVADDPNTPGITETWKPAAILADSIHILSNRWRMDDFNGTVYDPSSNAPISQDVTPSNTAGVILPGKTLCYLNAALDNCNYTGETPAQVNSTTYYAGTANNGLKQTNPVRPSATQTWVNVAFLSGTITPANEGDAVEGGLNNYPKFYENWSVGLAAPGVTANSYVPLNYRGSFVSLKKPAYTVAPYCGAWGVTSCNIYMPPQRNWDFENTAGVNNAGFNDAANLPPLSPRAVYLRQEVFTRNYDRASIDIPNPLAFLPSPTFNFGLIAPGQR